MKGRGRGENFTLLCVVCLQAVVFGEFSPEEVAELFSVEVEHLEVGRGRGRESEEREEGGEVVREEGGEVVRECLTQ